MAIDPPSSDETLMNLLPLPLLRSQIIPPAPNRSKSAVDFIYDFAGSSWIAYGASSLLVVSHFPSPLSEPQTLVGPSFHQVVDPQIAGDVTAVSWCPARPSSGEFAAAVGDCVLLFRPDSGTASGSFCWRQTAGLIQSFAVEAIEWTGSGDGLIAAGADVVMWKRKNTCWEISWKSKAELPQDLVSATWYAEGLVATAANPSNYIEKNAKNLSSFREDCARVSVYYSNENSGPVKVQLCHPHPVTMIQWRPPYIMRSSKDALHTWRDVLLTRCLDGTVRLWSEIDNGRARKSSKELYEHRRSFHVVAVIEINHCLNGTLGTDINIRWAIEFDCVVSKIEGDGYCLSSANSEHDQIGKCDWLISIGPGHTLTLWAIHCLDDTNPLRCPRVTLWKKQNLMDFRSYNLCNSDFTDVTDQSILIKAVALRSRAFGPPIECSLVQLLPNNSLSWSQLYTSTQNDAENRSMSHISKDKSLSCCAGGVLNIDGHTGSIIQLAIHPYYETELAVSLDSNGFLLFWSLPTISNCTLGMQMLVHPMWRLLGKISLQNLSNDIEYSSLAWAPSVLDDNLFLLLGYADGIDCFLIKLPRKEKCVLCDKILTVPFTGHSHGIGPPDQLSATPLASCCGQSFFSNSFVLFATWTQNFRASSWKLILHCADPAGSSCGCGSDSGILSISGKDRSISLAGKGLHATITLGSSLFPDPHKLDHVTSVSVISPNIKFLSIQQRMACYSVPSGKYPMATGCSDGTLKLWKMSHAELVESELEFLPWELVGMFTAHEGPVTAVSMSSCGGKVATVCMNDGNRNASLRIWEPICLISGGSFILEDEISLDEPVISLNFMSIGNGRLLLAVCLPNELRIYSEKRSDLFLPKSDKSREAHFWCCIALSHTSPVSHDFLWGPKATPLLIHKKQFSLLSQWLFIAENESRQDSSGSSAGGTDENTPFPIFAECDIYDTNKSSRNSNKENGLDINTFCSKTFHSVSQKVFDSDTGIGVYSLLDAADSLCETLAVYHPMALLQHLYAGNWKRAYVVLKHLFDAIRSGENSATSSESCKSGKSCNYVPEIDLSRYFEEIVSTDLHNKGFKWGQDIASGAFSLPFQGHSFEFADDNSEKMASAPSPKSEILGFIDILEKPPDINVLRNIDRIQLLAIIDLVGELNESSHSSAYDSLDKPGRRFWVVVRFQRLYSLRKYGKSVAEEFFVNSRLFAWAFQSDCQDSLLSSLLSANPSWPEMRNLGIGYWFTNATQLRTRMEKLARSQYLIRKDPKDCALLYMALNRLQVLSGLFKINKDEKDKLLVGFLSRNFQEEKNKAAALKNAYVLMGRHQLELAIAFFILGGDPSSAVTACAKNLGDEQLALVICRLIEGPGGQLERQLISNIMLPYAIEKEDYWLAGLLEWALGNYLGSISKLLYSCSEAVIRNYAVCNISAFIDPDIGQYCVTLATKNNVKNSLGDRLVMVLSKLATLMSVSAFSRCGLPLEALECLSSSFSIEGNERGGLLDIENHMVFHKILKPVSTGACNWLQTDIAYTLELNSRMNMAMQYISKLLKDHPSWVLNDLASSEKLIFHQNYAYQDEQKICECQHKVDMTISTFEQKYFIKSVDLANMILVFASNNGLFFHGYRIVQSNSSQGLGTNQEYIGSSISGSVLSMLLPKASKELSYAFSRYIVCCSLTDSIINPLYGECWTTGNESHIQFHRREICLKSIIFSLRTIRPLIKPFDFCDGLNLWISSVLDFLEYFMYFSSTWFSRNVKCLILMIQNTLNEPIDNQSSFEVTAGELMKFLGQSSEWVAHDVSSDVVRVALDTDVTEGRSQQNDASLLSIPDDEMWQLIGASFWTHLSGFVNRKLSEFPMKESSEDGSDLMSELPILVTRSFVTSMAYISSSVIRQLASFLRHKAPKGLPVTSFVWLDDASHHQSSSLQKISKQRISPMEVTGNEEKELLLQKLWDISARSDVICENFVNERIVCFPYSSQKFSGSWNDVHKRALADEQNDVSPNNKAQGNTGNSTSVNEGGSMFSTRPVVTDGLMETRRKNSSPKKDISSFHKPIEVLKRSGELLEAICFNSIDEQQVAVASNRKGLLFFNWKNEQQYREQAEYIWSESDWPQGGWAGCESTPIPTYVSQGIGLGSKRGAHLGLGGATVGFGSLARPGRDLTGGGAFGIPGYAGIGAAGLGWGEQEDFEEFADPIATVTNISSQALTRHPCMPFFLVGSTNTHIYLWQFGKDRATATYGILPAANVPPPYALASISALQLDQCGHRFASAALDGTVCTWQLEVGGRSNVYPTESSFCFSNHASDVAYVSASGSILAAAGYSTNNVNVVVWDTLAPSVTSQASVLCHEGGARSLSVFDNDVGSGSISPLIVTGGKSGDVGLHDFRFIATGKTKCNKNSSRNDVKSAAVNDDGMLWYIPRAHLGSVAKVETIPNTSLFLTGSKDGDVKLWDAKRSELVFHWQKMHDRHTFLQPNSRSIGGVVRAAVTDIQVFSHGFLTCGGDGSVKLVQLK